MRCLLHAAKVAFLAFVVVLGACSSSDEAHNEIAVAAAADLRFALDEASAAFHQEHPEWTVQTSFGSSGVFYSQLQNGAPYDLYLSADVEYPKRLEAKGMIAEGTLFTYAVGRIGLWAREDSELDVAALGAKAFTDPRMKKLAIANPQHAPYGRAAESALRSLGVYDAVADKLVLGENVSQTLQFVQSGAADAGIVALALALAPEVRNHGRYWEIPLDAYPRMEQGGAVMKSAKNAEGATAMREFLLSSQGRAILKGYGFFLPE